MSSKKIFSWILLLFGEAVLITAFLVFRGKTADNILTLNIIVSSIIYGLFFFDILVPWIDLNDDSQRRVGSLGVRWFSVLLYALLSIATMICSNIVYDLTFQTQLVIHGGLFFILLLGLLGASHSSDKVKQVYDSETAHRSRIIEMKNVTRNLKDKMNEIGNFPDIFTKQIATLEENLRFISPSNLKEAHDLENEFVTVIHEIGFSLVNFEMNREKIENNLKKLERIYQNRKNIFSK